ncbi:ISNCY family transposase [Acaryochloris sp. 'Moss Beach']|uniref:ISNCY family transposase n=1 Tax=Acaryochloris sp. 'Moss Beach' TaxID=2740837 RepID=UPI0037C0D155
MTVSATIGPQALISAMLAGFSDLRDLRKGRNKQYRVEDALMSAFSLFFMQSSSFLQYQRQMATKKGRSNAKSLFGIEQIPCDNQIRSLLDPVAASAVCSGFESLHQCLESNGKRHPYKCFEQGYLVALDGTEYFSSQEVHCPQCSQRHHRNGRVSYFHQVVTPVMVKPGCNQVLNLAPEFIRPQDGHDKQDCETTAAKRWIEAHPIADTDVGVTLLGDDLYSRQPMCQTALEHGYGFIFVCLPTSHEELYEWLEYLEKAGEMNRHQVCRYQGAKPLLYQFRYVNRVPLNAQQPALEVNWCEVTVIDKRKNKQVYFNTFVTQHLITHETIEAIVEAGRSRWKVENENNNVLKTKGYHLEHNFGHGQEHLAELLVTLNLLAFLMHTILELLGGTYGQLRELLVTRKDFFRDLFTLTRYFWFASWDALFDFMLTEGANST